MLLRRPPVESQTCGGWPKGIGQETSATIMTFYGVARGTYKPIHWNEGGQEKGVQYSWTEYNNSGARSVNLAAWYPFVWIFTAVNGIL